MCKEKYKSGDDAKCKEMKNEIAEFLLFVQLYECRIKQSTATALKI